MRKQSGQSIIEFALIAPVFFLMCFGMIYGGILFMDYLQYNNAANAIARAAVIDGIDKAKSDKDKYINPITNLYVIENPDNIVQQTEDKKGVQVNIKLKLNSDLPKVLVDVGFPPKELKTITCTMRMK